MPLSHNLRGALFMSLSMAGFTFNDVFMKIVSARMNMGEAMFIRGIFATLFIFALAWSRCALRPVRLAFHPMIILRIIGEAGGTVTFLIALAYLPLANVSAILQALPLAVTFGAAMFLAEPIGWRRMSAILVGFLGVLIVVRPGVDGFSVYSLLVVGTVFFAALRDIATRLTPPELPSLFLSAITAPCIMVVGLAIIQPLGGWSAPSAGDIGMMAIAAAFLLVGYQFIILSMRVGEISFIAPFRYTSLLWAILLGVVVFHQTPDAAMLIGSAIIVGSGLYTLYRERIVKKKPGAAAKSLSSTPPARGT